MCKETAHSSAVPPVGLEIFPVSTHRAVSPCGELSEVRVLQTKGNAVQYACTRKRCTRTRFQQEVISKLKADCEKIISAEKNWIVPAKEIFPFLHFEKADPEQLEEFLSEIKYTYQILLNLPEEHPDAVYCYKASW